MNIRRTLSSLSTFGLFAALCSVIAVTAANTPAEARSATARCGAVEVVAHRGSPQRYTENTIPAYRDAVAFGARTIETDFRLTADGEWVVMHDPTINKTTRASGHVSRLSSATLSKVSTNNGGKIPTLADVVRFAQSYPSVHLQIEIKSVANRAQMQKLMTALSGLKNRSMITSFQATPLRHARSIDPSWNTGYITNKRVSLATARSLGKNVLTNYKKINRKYVKNMQKGGIRVYAWTANTKSSWKKSVSSGVNGIITDKVAAMRKYCK